MITRRQLLCGTGVSALALAVGSCSDGGASTAEDLHGEAAVLTLPWDDTPHTGNAATASARIAWNLMAADEGVRTINTCIAVSSLAVTLSMLAEGATGNSLQSLDQAFGLSGDERSAAIGALRQALADYEDLPASVDAHDPPEIPVVHQANRVVILDEAEIRQDFLDRLSSYYDTGVTRLPRKNASTNLDEWARKHTAGLVKDSAITVRDRTRLINQDALLLAARWRRRFDRDDAPLSFTTGDGGTADLDALWQTVTTLYVADADWEAVRLFYDDVLAMDIIVPTRGVHPSELDFDTINSSTATLSKADERSVALTMPPSDIRTTWDLLTPLAEQGIDLTNMTRIFNDATTGQLAQQVRLTVTAEGTVGAALTESGTDAISAPAEPVRFTVDRPFVMRVLDTRTGWPLFLAIVNDPTDAPN